MLEIWQMLIFFTINQYYQLNFTVYTFLGPIPLASDLVDVQHNK